MGTTAKWPMNTVKEVCECIIDCVNKTAPTVKGETPYRMIRTTNVRDGYVNTETVRYVEKKIYEKWIRRGVPKCGDVILTREAPLGEIGLLRDDANIFLGQRLVMYRADPKKMNNLFLLYSMMSYDVQAQIKSFGSGSTVEHMRVPDCEKIELATPPLPTQRKIASILSAYDDLIENNLRRIKILEEMAQNLYREWFVKFRFPGHEKVKFVDSPLGEIPEGWEVKSISDVARVHRGRSYRSKDLVKEGGLPFINLKCINRDGGFRRDGIKRYTGVFKQTHVVNPGDIVMAVTDMTQERRIVARVGKIPFLDSTHGVISMDLVSIEPDEDVTSKEFLYYLFRFSSFADHVKQYANGANVLHLSPDRIREHQFVHPENRITRLFEDNVNASASMLENMHQRNKNLRQTRDLLLPKLISGKLDVSDLDIQVSEDTA